jgi:anaerobic dimethyl sulfoxide reductase subunit C (anchor subunit)
MNKDSWSLVFFTLLSQACAGLMMFFASLYFIDSQTFQTIPKGFSFVAPDFLAILMIAVAMLFSFLHLGKPLHAHNAMNNISSSWLSREIFAVLLFGASVLMVFLVRLFSPVDNWLMAATLLFSAIAGVFLVAIISKVYLIKTIPPWNSWYTPMGFYCSALTSGGSVLIFLILLNTNSFVTDFLSLKTITIFCWIVALSLFIEVIATLVHKTILIKKSPAGTVQKPFTSGRYHTLHLLRVFILSITIIFTTYFIIRLPGLADNFQVHLRFFAMIFSLIVIEEIIGRYQFYASYFRIGV